MLEGRGFAAPITETGLFPGMVTQMMRVGEETGTLDRQLGVAAEYYEKELTFKLTRLTALFEPLMIVVMGWRRRVRRCRPGAGDVRRLQPIERRDVTHGASLPDVADEAAATPARRCSRSW